MKLRQLLADFERDYSGAIGVKRLLGPQHFREIAAFHELHGDEEVAVEVAEIVDLDHPRVDGEHLTLDGGAAPFGFEDLAAGGIASSLHQLERGLAVFDGVDGEVDV